MMAARDRHTATLLQSGNVLAAGGTGTNSNFLPTTEMYDPVANVWIPSGSMMTARYDHTATLLGNGEVLVAGGANGMTLDGASAELYLLEGGSPCASASDCQSGFCADGVCCNTACSAGPCDACAVAAGAAIDGTCALFTGPVCNDGNACTQTDTCENGVCTGMSPVVCSAIDQCHAPGFCDSTTATCSNPAKPGGSSCDDGNKCTPTDTCQSGACVPGTPTTCTALDQCHDPGTCAPATGTCSNPAKQDGAPCTGGTCQSAACVPTPDGGADAGTGGAGGSASSNSTSTSASSSSGHPNTGTGGASPSPTTNVYACSTCPRPTPPVPPLVPAALAGALFSLAARRRRRT